MTTACTPSANTEQPAAELVEQAVEAAPEVAPTNAFAQQLATAHQQAAFDDFAVVQFDLQLSFGGRERFNGTISLSTDSRRGVLATKDGGKIYFSDDKIYVDAAVENSASKRFAAYTWPYFFLLPYKVDDQGTMLNDYTTQLLNGQSYLTQKLTFAPGTGDAPDDWYILYADEQTQLLQVAAYIVTAGGTTQAEAEEDPHAIEYLEYTEIEGIPIARHWKFWAWRTEAGLTDQLGEASISNISFLKTAGDLFQVPKEFQEG